MREFPEIRKRSPDAMLSHTIIIIPRNYSPKRIPNKSSDDYALVKTHNQLIKEDNGKRYNDGFKRTRENESCCADSSL